MKYLFAYIRNRLGLFLAGTVSAIAAGVSTSQVIALLKQGLDDTSNITESFILQIFGFSVLATLLGILSGYFVAKMTAIVIRNLTLSLSEKILQADYEYIESNSERIVPVLTRDINMLSEFINRFPQFLVSSTTVVLTIALLFSTDWQLTSFFLGAFLLQIAMVAWTLPYVRTLTRKSTKHSNSLYRDLGGLVSGLKELSLNKQRRSKYIGEVLAHDVNKWNQSEIKRKVLLETTDRLSDLLVFVFSGLLMYLGVFLLPIDFNVFKVILPTILFLIPFTVKIASFFRLRSTALVSLEQIKQLGIEIEKRKIASDLPLNTARRTKPILAFDNIEFRYKTSQHENPIHFGPLNVRFQKNKITFIIGGNGSGKTTFSKLLTGLYTPTSGKIYYKGQEIETANILSYRNLFSAYYADSYVFSQLSHIRESFLDQHAENYIAMLELEEKVEVKKQKFSTTRLSYGQKSRLALIANMLDDKEIYLFDEWAANQDPHFKRVFYQEILPFLKEKKKTIIVISHDEKYFDIADEIIELQEGMVAKDSTYQTSELLPEK